MKNFTIFRVPTAHFFIRTCEELSLCCGQRKLLVNAMSKNAMIKLDDPPTAEQIDALVRWAHMERSAELQRLFKQCSKWLASRVSALATIGTPRQVH